MRSSRLNFDKYISLQERLAAISEFEKRSILIRITEKINICRDTKDNKFLSLALSAKARYIISGDDDLLVLHPFRGIDIITPSDFLSLRS